MRLITHNMLQCHVKNCNNNNFPLRFEDVQVELIEADFNPEFLSNMLNKIDWDALTSTAVQVICLDFSLLIQSGLPSFCFVFIFISSESIPFLLKCLKMPKKTRNS